MLGEAVKAERGCIGPRTRRSPTGDETAGQASAHCSLSNLQGRGAEINPFLEGP